MVYTFEYLQHFNINKPPKSSKLISRTKDMHEKYLKYKPNQLNLMLELFSNGNLYTIKEEDEEGDCFKDNHIFDEFILV